MRRRPRPAVPVLPAPPAPPPPGRLLCGADLGDGVTCKATAGVHDDHVTAAGIDKVIAEDMAKAYANGEPGVPESFGLRRYLDPSPAEVDEDVRRTLEHPVGPLSAVATADETRPLPEWSTEYKLRHTLGRPSLARRLCAHLEPAEAAELAEVLDGLFERRMAEVGQAVNEVTAEILARMAEDAQAKLREVRSERFSNGSRLS